MRTSELLIFGAGGHSKVVIETARVALPDSSIRLFDNDPHIIGQTIVGCVVESWPDSENPPGQAHISVGKNATRRSIGEQLESAGVEFISIISPNAVVSNSASIGNGAFIAPSAVLAAESNIGIGAIINHAAIVDHESAIGDYCHIAPGAVIAGRCEIGSGTLIGSGACVLPGIKIGLDVVVGSGSVVTRDIENGTRCFGAPAKRIDT